MADVAHGHGGDTSGGPPGGPPDRGGYWQTPNQCEASDSSGSSGMTYFCNFFYSWIWLLMFFICSLEFVGRGKRGKTRNVGLRKILEANNGKLLEISFERGKHNTYKPIGNNAKHFSSLVGTIVDRLPYNTRSWEKVPAEHKAAILPELQVKFF